MDHSVKKVKFVVVLFFSFEKLWLDFNVNLIIFNSFKNK